MGVCVENISFQMSMGNEWDCSKFVLYHTCLFSFVTGLRVQVFVPDIDKIT